MHVRQNFEFLLGGDNLRRSNFFKIIFALIFTVLLVLYMIIYIRLHYRMCILGQFFNLYNADITWDRVVLQKSYLPRLTRLTGFVHDNMNIRIHYRICMSGKILNLYIAVTTWDRVIFAKSYLPRFLRSHWFCIW